MHREIVDFKRRLELRDVEIDNLNRDKRDSKN
jgi:hypothetical protein